MKMTTLLAGTAALALTSTAATATAAEVVADAAADAAAEDQSAGTIGEEIVVTVQKSEQKLADVPITITAFGGKALREIGVTQFDQLAAFVPGVNVQEQSPNNPGFVIRGITSDTGSSQGAPAVTIYLNGVDVSRSRGSYFDLYDLERVEVVKGPQSTLFGTAAAIGAFSVITNKPTKDAGAELRLAYGNFNKIRDDGFVNTGGDVLSARLAFAVKLRDGVVPNIAGRPGSQTPNGPRIDDLNGQGQYGARLSVRYDKDDVLLDLVATYDGQRAPGTAFSSGTFAPTGGTTSPYTFKEVSGSPVSRAALGLDQPGLERNVYDINLTGRFTLSDSLTLTQIFGYRRFDSLEVFDADGTQAWYLEFAEDAQGEQFSTETRLNYTGDKARAFVGLNYFHENGFQRVPFSSEEGIFLQCAARVVPGIACINNATGVVEAAQVTSILTGGAATQIAYSSEFRNSADIDTISLFADVSLDLTDRLELNFGARALWEDRQSGYFARVPRSTLTGGASLIPGQIDTNGQTLRADGNFGAFLPRANLLWKATDDLRFYLTWSRGRRSPVVNLNAGPGGVPNRTDIAAEITTNYEAGVKFANGTINASLGAFLLKYDNFQVSLVRPGLPNITASAGGATNQGVEAEFAWTVSDRLNVFANGAFIDARVDNDPRFPTFANDRFRLQSKWQWAIGGTGTLPLGESLELFVTPTVTYRSSLFFELPNNPVTFQGPVTLVNLRAGVRHPEGKWEIIGYANNLLNKQYLLDGGNTGGAFGIPTFIRGLPRLFGVEGVYRF